MTSSSAKKDDEFHFNPRSRPEVLRRVAERSHSDRDGRTPVVGCPRRHGMPSGGGI